MIQTLRSGLVSVGRVFQRSDVSAIRQAWLAGSEVPGGGDTLNDPYTGHGLVFRCVNLIGMAGAAVPFELLDAQTDQPVFEGEVPTFWERPNEHMTFPWFLRVWLMFAVASGNGDLLIDGLSPITGMPKRIIPLAPGNAQPRRRGTSTWVLDGWDVTHPITGQRRMVPPDRVIRLQYAPTADPHVGIGPVQVARLAAATDRNAALHNFNSMRNGGTPPGVLTLKGVNYIRPEQRQQVKDEWAATVGGVQNAGRIAVLTGDMEFDALGFSPKDMEYLGARKWNKEEIATYLDVPLAYVNASAPHGLGDAGMRVEERRLYQTNVGPLLGQAAEALNRIVEPMSDGRLYGRFNLQVIEALQPQMNEKAQQFVQLAGTGLFTRNELNDRLDMGFEENDEWGDDAFMPSGLTTAKQVKEGGGMQDMLAGLLGGGGGGPGVGGGGALPAPGGGDGDIDLTGDDPLAGGDVEIAPPLPELDLGAPPKDVDLLRDLRKKPLTRGELWWRASGRPLQPLYERALGRSRKHFNAQRSRVIKALARRKSGRGGVRWLPPQTRVSDDVIRQAVEAYDVGGLARAIAPVAVASWIDGYKAAQREALGARRALTRARGDDDDLGDTLLPGQEDDDLRERIKQALDSGLITPEQAETIVSQKDLDEAILKGPPATLRPAGVAPIPGEHRFPRIEIPLEYAPRGTEKIVLDYFDPHLQMLTSIDEQIRDAIGETLREGWEQGETLRDLKERIKDLMEFVSEKRAVTIARTETATFRNGARWEFMQAQGVQRVQWLSARDPRVRDSHADIDGDVVDLGEQFRNGLRFPCEVGGPPEEVINCRCTLLPIAEGLTDDESDSLAELGL